MKQSVVAKLAAGPVVLSRTDERRHAGRRLKQDVRTPSNREEHRLSRKEGVQAGVLAHLLHSLTIARNIQQKRRLFTSLLHSTMAFV